MQTTKLYDVIVVGAGPAGSMAGRALASRGLEVLILEKHPWPRVKLCGGGLTPKSYRTLGPSAEALVKRKCDRVLLRAGRTGPFDIRRHDTSIWMVDRKELDVMLLEKAQGEGARFADGVAVRRLERSTETIGVVTSEEVYRARVVIGADGFDSAVAKQAGLRRDRDKKYFLALQTELRPKVDSLGTCAIVDFGFRHGYAWVFPKGEQYSVGVGSSDAKLFKHLSQYLDRFLAASGLGDEERTPYRGHKLPFGGTKEQLHNGNIVLVGDAAGLADPLFGEGISYAMKSGELAASAIVDFLNGKAEDLSGYTEKLHRTIVKDLRALQNVAFFVHRFPGVAVRILSRSRGLQNIVTAIISGDRGHSMWSDERFLHYS